MVVSAHRVLDLQSKSEHMPKADMEWLTFNDRRKIKMKLKKMLYLLLGMLVFAACFFYGSMHPHAVEAAEESKITISANILNAGNAAGDLAGTGEENLDASMNRGVGIVEGMCRALGVIIGIVGIVIACIGFFGHQDDMKARSPMIIGAAVVVYYAPEIFRFLVGK